MKRWIWGIALSAGLVAGTAALAQQQNLSIVTGGTGAATRHVKSDASNWVMARVPLSPRLTWSQKHSRPIPKGDTTPMPVMTTRRRECSMLFSPRRVPSDALL